MRGWIYLAILFGVGLAAENARAATLACLDGFRLEPGSRRVGVETIHRTDSSVITIFLPMPTSDDGIVHDLNALEFGDALPKRFTFSDGSLGTAFVDVDTRPGSRLLRCVRELTENFLSAHQKSDDAALVHFLDTYLDPIPEGRRLSWEPKRSPALPPEFAEVADSDVGHFPVATKLRHVEVPLEAFLRERKGVCVQRVLLLSLVMRELGLRHRIRAGGTEGGGGHVWIELPDQRHLDPTWHLLEKPVRKGAFPGWFRMDQTYLFRNQVFPIVVD